MNRRMLVVDDEAPMRAAMVQVLERLGHTVYAASGRTNGEYFGTRRTAYSSNPTINAQSFRHIQEGEPLPTGQPLRINGRPLVR